MNRKRFDALFRACPGAWLGAPPEGSYGGHITVDVKRIVYAIRYLAKRRIRIRESRMSIGCENGIQLFFERKDT